MQENILNFSYVPSQMLNEHLIPFAIKQVSNRYFRSAHTSASIGWLIQ